MAMQVLRPQKVMVLHGPLPYAYAYTACPVTGSTSKRKNLQFEEVIA